MFEIQTLQDEQKAKEIGQFLIGPNVFDHTWFAEEKEMVKKAVLESLQSRLHRYWYIENEQGEVIAAIGIRKNKCDGGFEMAEDYLGVHRDYRGNKLATKILETAESFVVDNGGRYIHILCCDTDSYAPTRAFYQKKGYQKVGEMPHYYVQGEGRVDYYKLLQ